MLKGFPVFLSNFVALTALIIFGVGCMSIPDLTYWLDNQYEEEEFLIDRDYDEGVITAEEEKDRLERKVRYYEDFSRRVGEATRKIREEKSKMYE